MSIFNTINTAATGLTTNRSWIDVISNNIANINTVEPMSGSAFQASFLEVQAAGDGPDGIGQGVQPVSLAKSSKQGRVTYAPQNPLADKNGYVRLPDDDLSDEMGNLIMAQRSFQANANVVDRAREVYQSAIDIGKK
jgi:flagellar basal-body rod protein FlgC